MSKSQWAEINPTRASSKTINLIQSTYNIWAKIALLRIFNAVVHKSAPHLDL